MPGLALYSPTAFFVGRSDDLTIFQYGDAVDQVYGSNATLSALADESMLDAFIAAADELPAPRILGMVIQFTDDEEEATKGLRFMGQRFVPDAYIFRQLIFRNVGTLDDRRGLPMGLDLHGCHGLGTRLYHPGRPGRNPLPELYLADAKMYATGSLA